MKHPNFIIIIAVVSDLGLGIIVIGKNDSH